MDLSNASNWNQVANFSQRAKILQTYPNGGYQSEFLKPFATTLATPVCIAKISPLDPEPYPLFAGWINFYLPLAGENTRITGRRLFLNKPLLIQIQSLGIVPYSVEVDFAPKLTNVLFELWQFTDQAGRYLSSSQQALFSAVEVVEQREEELRELVLKLQPQGDRILNLEIVDEQ